jgi:acyl-CoA synthetase (AMP-forming)/AMP-acid ligase II
MGSANVARFLEERAVDSPERAAVLAPQGRSSDGTIKYERLSFAQLNGETEQLAAVFRETGISRGTRVLLMVKPGSDLIRCCFTLFKVGAVPVVIDPGMGVRSFLQCVRRSKPEAVVGIPLAILLSRLFGSSFRQTRTRLTVGKGLMRKAAAFPEKGEGSVESTADELAAILFTSGSTGPAKGVCYQHEQFDAQVQLVRESFGIEAGEVDLPMLPLFALFNPALGMTTVVPELNPGKPATVQPEKILQALDQCAVTNSFGSPVLWQKLSAHAAAKGISFPGVRRILMAGAPVAPVLYRQMRPVFPEAQLISPYGATECLPVSAIEGGMVLNETAAQTEAGAGTCVGFPVSGVAVRIIRIADEGKAPGRSDLEEPLPAGEIG